MLLTNVDSSETKTACKLVHIKSVPVLIKKTPALQLEFLTSENRPLNVEVQPSTLEFNDETKEITSSHNLILTCFDKEYEKIKEQLTNPPEINNKVNLVHILSETAEENTRKFNDLQVDAFSVLRSSGYDSINIDDIGNPFYNGSRKIVFVGSVETFTHLNNLLETQFPSLQFVRSIVVFETLDTWPLYSLTHYYVEANRLNIYNYKNDKNALATLTANISTLEKCAV